MSGTVPITRLEGHLGISVETEAGRISSARIAGEMFRGFEVILKGRHPLDAQRITQSICGVCPVEHGTASVFAQEAATGVEVPSNARLLRNLIQAGNILASHLTHFYLLSGPDFTNVAGLLDYHGTDPALRHLQAFAQQQLRAEAKPKLANPVGPFLPQVTDVAVDAGLNAQLLSHYAECLGVQNLGIKAVAHKLVAVFAGKMPHAATLIPGGVTEQVSALKIEQARALLEQIAAFVERAYWPDALAVAAAFPAYFELGRGPGAFLSYGVFPEGDGRFLPAGVLRQGTFEPLDLAAIAEDVKFSWFENASGLHPQEGQTIAAPDKSGAYSWLKAPRYRGAVMEVGPLARLLIAYDRGHAAVRTQLDAALKQVGRAIGELNSVLGRHLARAVETRLLVAQCRRWLDQLEPGKPASVEYRVPDRAEGVGLTEAARGALGHWLRIEHGVIANYQCVVPTTWNCSPRDDRGQPGAVEQALVGAPNPKPEEPVAAMRIVRSFDPCLACAVH